MKKAKRVILIGWLIFSFLYVGLGAANRIYADELSDNARLIGTVLSLIHNYYVDEIKLRDIVYPAIKEMVNQLDPHSHFLTPEENKKLEEEMKDTQEYAGVGMIVGFREKDLDKRIEADGYDINQAIIEVKKPFDGSPAKQAGLLPKDEILAIDGVPVKKIGADEVSKIGNPKKKVAEKIQLIVKKVLGPVGTSVTLTIKRAGWDKPKDFTIIRQTIRLKNVEWKVISGVKKVGYLNIRGFMADSTVKEVGKAIKEFNAGGVDGIILDLRNNGGGRLNICLEILQLLLPADTKLISEKGKTGQSEFCTDSGYTEYLSVPIVILINENSASASEVTAGVLRDHKRAILIGEKTFGKGSVQRVFDFRDGSSLRLTMFKYFLPNGECIHEKGISPHIEVETQFDEPIMTEALKVLQNWKTYKDSFLK